MTASRLSRILRLSDRGIGAFEYSYETDAITFTDGFFATLSTLEPPDPSYFDPQRIATGSLSASEFESLMKWYVPYIEVEEEAATSSRARIEPRGFVSWWWKAASTTACSASWRT